MEHAKLSHRSNCHCATEFLKILGAQLQIQLVSAVWLLDYRLDCRLDPRLMIPF